MKLDRALLLTSCLCLLAACGSPESKVEEEIEGARSWMSTVELVAERWRDNRVPTRYAQRSLKEALTYLAASDEQLASAKAKRDDSNAAREHIQLASRATKSILLAIDANDRAAAEAPLSLLSHERGAMDSIVEKAGGQ